MPRVEISLLYGQDCAQAFPVHGSVIHVVNNAYELRYLFAAVCLCSCTLGWPTLQKCRQGQELQGRYRYRMSNVMRASKSTFSVKPLGLRG
jgi:hypothetical protein